MNFAHGFNTIGVVIAFSIAVVTNSLERIYRKIKGQTMIDVEEAFDAARNEFNKFDHIEKPLHPRPDICAFLKLHELVPGTHDMVAAAEHDEIFLNVEVEKLAEVATQEDIVFLTRCGVRYGDYDSLAMFV